ncbi:MAG: hypothetical protein LQ350_001365 [Teloschistes chrysophthalmus]|nr:MAG: hypothetical protein LQ350_001365 [Niorma chrysophthalma]
MAPVGAETTPKEGGCLHFSAMVMWYHRSDLIFYNDLADYVDVEIAKNATRLKLPKQWKKEMQEQFEPSECYNKYVASEPHDVDIIPKGNSMTQPYYTKKILPIYRDELKKAEAVSGMQMFLQEDNDPSHGMTSPLNYALLFKEKMGHQWRRCRASDSQLFLNLTVMIPFNFIPHTYQFRKILQEKEKE